MQRPQPFPEAVYVTRPILPPKQEMHQMIDAIWASQQLTNHGPLHNRLEAALRSRLDSKYLSLFCNGTIALHLACQALKLKGEVITSAFSFPAAAHVLYFAGIKPVFCDVREKDLTLDPRRIEEWITPQTSAIMPVHVFGYPCQTATIQEIADRHGLRVIYDAAHCFDVIVDGTSIANFGDISMFSFHATKLFHSAEGGALTYREDALRGDVESLKHFGFRGENIVGDPGLNGKMNELQAAVGLLVLEHVDREREKRRTLTNIYRERLHQLPGITVKPDLPNVRHNYYCLAARICREQSVIGRDQLFEQLREFNIVSRKYFLPLCSHLQIHREHPSSNPANLPVSERSAQEALSLPLYGLLAEDDVHKICDVIEYLYRSHPQQ